MCECVHVCVHVCVCVRACACVRVRACVRTRAWWWGGNHAGQAGSLDIEDLIPGSSPFTPCPHPSPLTVTPDSWLPHHATGGFERAAGNKWRRVGCGA